MMKDEGLRSGIPDYFLAVPMIRDRPSKDFYGLFIELKAPGGTVHRSQKEMIEVFNTSGYKAVICYGWDAARLAIEEYLKR